MQISSMYNLKVKLSPDCTVNQVFYVLPKLEEECIFSEYNFYTTTKSPWMFSTKKWESVIIRMERQSSLTGSLKYHFHFIVSSINLDFEIGHLKEEPLYVKFLNLLISFTSLFASTLLDIRKTTAIKHHIVTNGATIVLPSYKTPFAHRPLLKKKIFEMEAGKIIERSTSAFRSPLLIIGKKSGEMIVCHDFRELNKITTKIRYPLPIIESILHLLHGEKYFTTLDLFSGFWQIEIAEEDRHKTAFSCEFGHFHYIRMPFGLCNAPSTFQKAMETILEPILNTFVMVYIDDKLSGPYLTPRTSFYTSKRGRYEN
jgi:hypothetical protein